MFNLKEYRKKNAKKIKEQRLEWYKKNRDKILLKQKIRRQDPHIKEKAKQRAHRWWLKNREAILAKIKNDPAKVEKMRQRSRQYYIVHRDELLARGELRQQANQEKINEQARNRYAKNPQKYRQYQKDWRQRNKERTNLKDRKRDQEKYKTDPQFKLTKLLRNRLNASVRNSAKRGSAVRNLGCTIPEFKRYLESQFEPGMSWDNWSKTGWHIDHIKSLYLFDLTNPQDVRRALHYTNMRPMWATDNLQRYRRKRSKS